jgi:hypothetical protein
LIGPIGILTLFGITTRKIVDSTIGLVLNQIIYLARWAVFSVLMAMVQHWLPQSLTYVVDSSSFVAEGQLVGLIERLIRVVHAFVDDDDDDA